VRKLQIQTVNAISYCFDLLSFIFQNQEAGKKIKSIYLFGSAVRADMQKSSDIDLFVECEQKQEEKVKSLVDSGIIKFTASKDYQKWKLFHFTYPFSFQMGQLAEWDLKLSIASEGILLYSKSVVHFSGQRKVLFVMTYPTKKKEYIKIRRLIFGRDESYYKETGLLKAYHGEKVSSNVFVIPKEYQTVMIDALSKEKVIFSMKEITVLE